MHLSSEISLTLVPFFGRELNRLTLAVSFLGDFLCFAESVNQLLKTDLDNIVAGKKVQKCTSCSKR